MRLDKKTTIKLCDAMREVLHDEVLVACCHLSMEYLSEGKQVHPKVLYSSAMTVIAHLITEEKLILKEKI